MIHEWRGRFAQARRLVVEDLAICEDSGFFFLAPFRRLWLGRIELHLGRFDKARVHAELALTRARDADNQFAVGCGLRLLGAVAVVEGAYVQAHQWLLESSAILHAVRQWFSTPEVGSTLSTLVYSSRGLTRQCQTQRYLRKALRFAIQNHLFLPLVCTLPVIALLLADERRAEPAVELYALALRYDYVANSCWFEEVAGRHITAVAATLPPEVVAAAQERGRARDLWETAQELLEQLDSDVKPCP